jgi:hypothetical protein
METVSSCRDGIPATLAGTFCPAIEAPPLRQKDVLMASEKFEAFFWGRLPCKIKKADYLGYRQPAPKEVQP